MSIVAHFHNTEGQDIGYICGPSIPNKKGWRLIRHARGCYRHGKPFIHIASGEIGSEYICYACHRAYVVMSDWGDRIDGTHRMEMPQGWWGWRHAQAVEAYRLEGAAPLWVQEGGKGIAHYQRSYGFPCGRMPMFTPMASNHPQKFCKRCSKEEA